MTPELPDVVDEEKTIVYKDKEVKLILIRPPYTKHEALPVVIYYHGGGWTFGSIYSYKKANFQIAVKAHVAVVFVEYILAPEVKFPGIHEECFAAFRWVVEHGRSIRVDVSMLALCGDTVGANIATSVSLMAKNHGLLDAIKTQILICPCVAPSHKDFESSIQFGNSDYVVSLADIQYQEELYYGRTEKTKYGFPLMASPNDLHGLPRALVISAEADLLRDETEAYARKLIEAGVPTTSFRALKAGAC
ncbi:Alpha/beta hydrolase fold-3 [Fennellomyces sp. T-0311]|nr:Alpha/beta hydrolase fold-3 [Fennellomyces sp. T-0311]